ncbi:MAG: ACT domain-containing protein [Rhodocyclaceae bacterium]
MTDAQDIVLTAIGSDRPGLVQALAETISRHEGNWLESSMAQLGGQFAGIVRVRLPAAQASPLEAALSALTSLHVVTKRVASTGTPAVQRSWLLEVIGHDRPGIVHEVSQVLARHAVNVEALDTYTSSAPMSAETLFHANARLSGGPGIDPAAVKAALEGISTELMVEIALDEVTDH